MNASLPTSLPDPKLRLRPYLVGFALVFVVVASYWYQPLQAGTNICYVGNRGIDVDLVALEQRIEAFRRIHGRLPSIQEGLSVLPELPPNPRASQRMAKRQIPKDPWGRDYVCVYPGKHQSHEYDLYTLGKDGQPGTADDFGNWDRFASTSSALN